MIVYTFDKHGAFIAGDTVSRVTCYAYPTSPHATAARRKAEKTAAEMVGSERRFGFAHEQNYDHRNWSKLTPNP